MAGDSYRASGGTSRVNGVCIISKNCSYIAARLLPVFPEGDRIRVVDTLSVMHLLQALQEAGAFRFLRKHALRQLRLWIGEFPDHKRLYEERLHAGITYGDRL